MEEVNGLNQHSDQEDSRREIAKLIHKHQLLSGYTDLRSILNEIEHAYRIGPNSDNRRPILVTFYARPVRNAVMGASKKPYNVSNLKPTYFTDDLCKPDLKKKKECGNLIQRVWEKRSYAKFIEGKLFIKNKAIVEDEIRAAERSTTINGRILHS